MDNFVVFELKDKLHEGINPTLSNLEYYEFFMAKEVGIFLWGKNCGKFIIYKNGKLASLSHLYGDIASLQEYLEGDIDYPKGRNFNE